MIDIRTRDYSKETKYRWEYIQDVFKYTYNAKSDDVTVHPGQLFKRKSTRHDIPVVTEDGLTYEYGIRIISSYYPATVNTSEGEIYRNTFWLAERDDRKAYRILKSLKQNQSKEYAKEVIKFSELEERYDN